MRKRLVIVTGVIVILGLIIGVGTLLVIDSPYDGNVDVDRNPVAPERPTNLNETSVSNHAVAYEQTRLFNDIIASRDHSLDTHDGVITHCNATWVSEMDTGSFRVQLRCAGGIDDTMRLFEPRDFSYTVTYRVTGNETKQINVQDYPFSQRDTLRSSRK